jgi:hypothetical protein
VLRASSDCGASIDPIDSVWPPHWPGTARPPAQRAPPLLLLLLLLLVLVLLRGVRRLVHAGSTRGSRTAGSDVQSFLPTLETLADGIS